MTPEKSPASLAISILIDMAQKGEINPWDVQVIEVIDRFLDELELTNIIKNSNNKEVNLSQSGQVILWASMLVLLKADTLEKLGQKKEDIEVEIEEELINNSERNINYLPTNLDKQIRRRTSAKPPSTRKVTLAEFIKQLEEIAAEIETNSPQKKRLLTNSKNLLKQQAIQNITNLAHNENLTELAGQLQNFFKQDLLLLNPNLHTINLEELLILWTKKNEQKLQDKVGVFWALLLLSSQSKIELSQSEFYQDLDIKLIIDNE